MDSSDCFLLVSFDLFFDIQSDLLSVRPGLCGHTLLADPVLVTLKVNVLSSIEKSAVFDCPQHLYMHAISFAIGP